MKIKFKIPNSSMVIVLWIRDNKPNETMIPRPANNEMLRLEMLKRKVGYSEIKAVKEHRETAVPSSADLNSLVHKFQTA